METMSQLDMPKRAVHILLPVISVVSFVLVSYSSLFLPFRLPLLSINLFSYSSERNYIFLLCNGILVFLIINSAFITNSALVVDSIKHNTHVEEARDEEERGAQSELLVSDSNKENPCPQDINEEEKQEQLLDIQQDDDNYCNNNDEEKEEDEDEAKEEREELNKRCEEFIRRMKQNIKIEATRPLILSN